MHSFMINDSLYHSNFSQTSPFTLYEWQFGINVYVILPLCCLGFVANLLTCLLLACRHRRVKQSTGNVFLITLSVLGALQLVLGTSFVFDPYLCDVANAANSSHPWGKSMCISYHRTTSKLMRATAATVDTAHIWTLTTLTLHRYWRIAHPIHAVSRDGRRVCRNVLMVVIGCAVLFRLPMFCEWRFVWNYRAQQYVTTATTWSEHPVYNIGYHVVLNGLLSTMIPFATLTLLNGLILKAIYKASNIRIRKAHSIRKRERRAALAVAFIVTIFLIFHCLVIYDVITKLYHWLRNMIHPTPNHVHHSYTAHSMINDVSHLLMMLSTSLNPCIYIGLGDACRFCCALECGMNSSSADRGAYQPPGQNVNNDSCGNEMEARLIGPARRQSVLSRIFRSNVPHRRRNGENLRYRSTPSESVLDDYVEPTAFMGNGLSPLVNGGTQRSARVPWDADLIETAM